MMLRQLAFYLFAARIVLTGKAAFFISLCERSSYPSNLANRANLAPSIVGDSNYHLSYKKTGSMQYDQSNWNNEMRTQPAYRHVETCLLTDGCFDKIIIIAH
jgi:hypothetical protein